MSVGQREGEDSAGTKEGKEETAREDALPEKGELADGDDCLPQVGIISTTNFVRKMVIAKHNLMVTTNAIFVEKEKGLTSGY